MKRSAFLAIFALACSGEKPSVAKTDSTTTTTAPAPGRTIQGAAGVLHVDDGGAGGLPVLFVHSFGGSSAHWVAQLAHLRAGRRAVAFDLRAHGASSVPANGDYSVDGFSGDIAAVADSLGLTQFVLVGHSLGGAASIVYAGAHPDRVAALVIVGTPGPSPPKLADSIVKSLESDQYQQVMDAYMARLLTGARPDVALQVDSAFRKLTREQSVAIIKAVFAYDPTGPLRRYSGPVLSVTTASDPDSPTAPHRLRPAMLHRTMDSTSHWMHMDKPGEFNAILDEFLKGK